MVCKTCGELLAAYKHAVRLYTHAERSNRRMLGDVSRLTFEESYRLRRACIDANDALKAHCRQDHSNRNEDADSGASP